MPAEAAGLAAGDRIQELDGVAATVKVLSDQLAAKKPGDTIKVRFSRGNEVARDLEIVLGKNAKVTYSLARISSPDPLQAAILADWLRAVR